MSPVPLEKPTVALAALAIALHAAAISAALSGAIPLGAGFAIAILSGYLAFTPLHEAVHGNVGRGLDAWIGRACGALLFAPFESFRELHLRHHRHPNDPAQDPDHWVASASPLGVAFRCVTILPRYYAAFAHVPPGARRPPLAPTLLTQAVFACVLALAWANGQLGAVLLLWPCAALLAGGALAFVFDWLPHRPHDASAKFPARVVLAPGFALVSMGHAYHLVHHVWPHVPFHRYGATFRARRGELDGARVDAWPRGQSTRRGTSTTARSCATTASGCAPDASTRKGSSVV